MVFKAMFPPKGKMTLNAQDSSIPGAKFPVELSFIPGEDIQPKHIRVELIGVETYYKREVRHTSKGTTTHIVKKDNTFTSITEIAVEAPVLVKDMEQKWKVVLQLPPNAHPTAQGKIVNIQWTLKAVMDVPNRIDLVQEKPVRIFCPPPLPGAVTSADAQQAYDDAAKQALQDVSDQMVVLQQNIPFPIFKKPETPGDITSADSQQAYNDIALNLKIPGDAKAGETLLGQLSLDIKDKVNVRGIRVELVQREDAGARNEDTVVVKNSVSGSSSYNQGEFPSFEFFMSVPAEAQPTSISNLSRLFWKVRAVLDRPMKKDFIVEKEVYIYNMPEKK